MSGRSNRPKDDSGTPNPSGVPSEIGQDTPQTRALIRALENSLHDFRGDLTEIKTRAHTDFFRMVWVFGAGFVLLGGMIIQAYRWGHDDLIAAVTRLEGRIDKADDRGVTAGNTLSKVDQKLDDLIARVPPAQTSIPRHP